MTATAHEAERNLERVLIGYVFVRIIKKLETCHIYEAVLLII
jgi:hypothetical protein